MPERRGLGRKVQCRIRLCAYPNGFPPQSAHIRCISGDWIWQNKRSVIYSDIAKRYIAMKKTYITTMPNHIGAFLKASECFAELGVNITRVSYNKAVDSHMLFIDAEGEPEQLQRADSMLESIGYLQSAKSDENIILLEFKLLDRPGSVREVLYLIQQYELNISYISSNENGTDFQDFKMGLHVESEERFKAFFAEAKKLCPVRILSYDHSEKSYDNSIFYQSFVSDLIRCIGLPESKRNGLLTDANAVMQILDDKGLSPYRTFESIGRIAHLLASCRGEAFSPRITTHEVTKDTRIVLIEPPCGSNTIILESQDEALFIDSGYALYRDEMIGIFRKLLPDYDAMRKIVFVTHADVDHCGLLSLFDEIIASEETKQCLALEFQGKDGYREQNPLHRPYVNICKALTLYEPVNPDRIRAFWSAPENMHESLEHVGFYEFGEMRFEVFIGKGGHLKGETVLIDYSHHIVFSGDVFINMHALTSEQAEYNRYAPVLMTAVDTDMQLCALERDVMMQRLGRGDWRIFGGHGSCREYSLSETKQ